MAYTLYQGVGTDNMDRVQRGLLVGLPAIAIILSLGALFHHRQSNNPAGDGAQIIPIVSSLSSSGSPAHASEGDGSPAANTSAPTASAIDLNSGSPTSSAITSLSGPTSSGLAGGRGGGPIGGSSGGILPINQTVIVPPIDVQDGGKSLVNTTGTTLNLN
jgi:hypothetical protein